MPGPDIIYVMVQSITNGKKYGIVTALGLVTGIIVHTTYIAFGLAALIHRSDNLFLIIKIFGGTYLFYLAFKTYQSNADIDLETRVKLKPDLLQLYKQGFVMNVLNPKVALFFLAFFPGFIVVSNGNITMQIYILGFLFMLQAFLVFTFVSVVSDRLTGFLRNNLKFENFLKWFQVFVFIAIGFFILFAKK
ncbi:MAG: LysE family translocator [Flavobacteriia bacterium]|nr:MAG: LysE family translocator [Flavobacteriia bacterium]